MISFDTKLFDDLDNSLYSDEELDMIEDRFEQRIKIEYNSILNEYISMFKSHSIDIEVINDTEKVVIIDNKHVTFIAVKKENMPTIYKYYSDDDILVSFYKIIIQDLIIDTTLKIDYDSFIKNHISRLIQHSFVYPNYVKDISHYENQNMFNNLKDDYLGYVSKKLPGLDLFKRYKENQNNRTIDNSNNLYNAIKQFNNLYNFYLSEYKDYYYKNYSISEYERVIVFEDSFVLYIGLKGTVYSLFDLDYTDSIESNYEIVFQELTSNDIFKFVETKFRKKVLDSNVKCKIHFIYNFFSGNIDNPVISNYSEVQIQHQSNFYYVNEKLPQINLLERYNSWNGWLYSFIVYELNNNKKGIFITHTTDPFPLSYARRFEKDLEKELLSDYVFTYMKTHQYIPVNLLKFAYNIEFEKECYKLFEDAKNNKWKNVKSNINGHAVLAEKMNYYVIPYYIKDKGSIFKIQSDLLKQAENNQFLNYERIMFDISDYKWKSEEMMYNCVKKIFKDKTVIHQYRPFFLKTDKGQLSYDVYVCGKNIAFEYQGKQHFEPVEIFGGIDNYKKQIERDKIKKQLSQKNGVKLILINYWEDISVELIKNKIREQN